MEQLSHGAQRHVIAVPCMLLQGWIFVIIDEVVGDRERQI